MTHWAWLNKLAGRARCTLPTGLHSENELFRILRRIEGKLEAIGKKLNDVILKEDKIVLDLTALETEVGKIETVEESVVTVIKALAQEVKDISAGADPATQAKLNDFAKRLDVAAQGMSDAVVDNTVAA